MADASKPQPDSAVIREYELYDRSVDVVSAFHWLYTDTKELPELVAHFERYPTVKVRVGDTETKLTPDFTVLFEDGTGLVAEIANIALHENSVDKLCRQLLNYSRITELPDGTGGVVPVTGVDVLFLSPIKTAADAVRRVFSERLDNPEHWYSPGERPALMQFAQQPDEYVFQLWPDKSVNGNLRPHGELKLASLDVPQLAVKPALFARNKVQYAFCNDPVPALYLATRLIVSVFPVMDEDPRRVFTTTVDDITTVLRDQYGHGRTGDVQRALELLKTAGLVTREVDGTWRILRGRAGLGRENVHVSIATRAAKAAMPKPKPKPKPAQPMMEGSIPLFDNAEQLEALLDGRPASEAAETAS